jgi:Ni,Fe-hydrogenase I cytochrome b subunit
MLSENLFIIIILIITGIFLYQYNSRNNILIVLSIIYFIFIYNTCGNNNLILKSSPMSTIYTELPDF